MTPVERLVARYPFLTSAAAPLRAQLDALQPVAMSRGARLFDEGEECRGFPMLLAGSVRVSKSAPNGREIQLYRVLPGESCILTSSCLLGHAAYSARGLADADLEAVVLPPPLFGRLIESHPPFRDYVFALFSERLADLMQLVEEVAFRRLDQRLAALLVAGHGTLRATHQELADELGSVREIVSRLLRGFADQGWVALGREQIEVLDRAALAQVAGNAR